MMGRMENMTSGRHKRRIAIDRAKITLNRNSVLRMTPIGRLLLVLERCVGSSNKTCDIYGRRMSRLISELSYARELADEAGVRNGWLVNGPGTFTLVFELSCGDVVFPGLNRSLGAKPFFREPLLADNSLILARAIAEIVSQAKNSALRRSTRIASDILVEVQGEDFAYAGETITVNLHGALVRIAAPLKCGDRVSIHVHGTGKSAAGAIVFASGESQFGIELETPDNIWGVALPPADWNAMALETGHCNCLVTDPFFQLVT
jgi:hypothetical protein